MPTDEGQSRKMALDAIRHALGVDPEIDDAAESQLYDHAWILNEFLKENNYKKLTSKRQMEFVRFAYYHGRRDIRPPVKALSIFEFLPKVKLNTKVSISKK